MKYKILSKENTDLFLLKDNDSYVNHFSNYDLKARNILSINEYLKKINNAGIKNIPTNILSKLDLSFSSLTNTLKTKLSHPLLKYIDIDKILNKKYRISFVKSIYEQGNPHTRNNIIFLTINTVKNNTNKQLQKLLFHEIIHIYQRYNDMDNYLRKFIKLDKHNYNIRSNPDITKSIYIPKNTKVILMEYKKNPKSISDTIGNFEHPFEYMSYKLEHII